MAEKKSRQDTDTTWLPSKIPEGMLAHYSELPSESNARPVCTWPLSTTEGRARLHQVIHGSAPSLWDLCEREPFVFDVCGLAAAYSEFESEDKPGELVKGPKLFMVGPDTMYSSGSEYVFRAIQDIARLEGNPPWHPAIRCQVYRTQTRNRRLMLTLVMLGRNEAKDDDTP